MKQRTTTTRRNLAILISLLFCFSLIRSSIQPLAAESGSVADVTFTVNRVEDLGDRNIGDGACDFSVNVGDQCTLRAAIEEMNDDPSQSYSIEFDIAGTGPFIIAPNSPLPAIEAQVTIDGSSQDGASCPTQDVPANLMIVLDGSNATGAAAKGFHFLNSSDLSQVKGMVIGNFSGAAIRIEGTVTTVWCSHIGIGADGVSPMPNGLYGLRVLGEGNVIGFDPDSSRNVISNNGLNAIRLEADGNFVGNNYIGTTADGVGEAGNGFGFPNAGGAIYISSDENTIGIEKVDTGNVIGHSDGFGILIDTGNNNEIKGNSIGVSSNGAIALPNSADGILINSTFSKENLIGGTAANEGNTIAFNSESGIDAGLQSGSGAPLDTKIRGNRIYENGRLGIEILDPGVTTVGAPLLEPALGGANVFIGLAGDPNTDYDIELFLSENCDPSGYGEGERYFAQVRLTTNAGGTTNHSLPLPIGIPGGTAITATSTGDETSEFSECMIIPLPTPTPTPLTVTPTLTPTLTTTVTPTGTLTPTITVTVDPDVTVTVAPTMTVTIEAPTDMPTATSTPSPMTPTPTSTGTITPSATPTESSTPTPTSTGTITPSATSTPLGEGEGDGQGQGDGFDEKVYVPVVNN